jgi:putative hydrolases of HD superfamily
MKRDIELLFEIGCFRYVPRMWKQFLHAEFANDAEHSFRVAWLGLIIATREGKGDHEKILKMALLHDLAESRTGDVQYLSRQYTQRNENLAVADIFKDTSLETDFRKLWQEYEGRTCIEAKIVKDADILDVDFELQEQASKGSDLKKQFLQYRKLLVKTFYTKAARDMWNSIYKANPHDWHLKGRNRINGGDWQYLTKKKKH